MAINIPHFKVRLLDKEKELSAAILRLKTEALDSRVAEVGDALRA